jgi:hypothetical protein
MVNLQQLLKQGALLIFIKPLRQSIDFPAQPSHTALMERGVNLGGVRFLWCFGACIDGSKT